MKRVIALVFLGLSFASCHQYGQGGYCIKDCPALGPNANQNGNAAPP